MLSRAEPQTGILLSVQASWKLCAVMGGKALGGEQPLQQQLVALSGNRQMSFLQTHGALIISRVSSDIPVRP